MGWICGLGLMFLESSGGKGVGGHCCMSHEEGFGSSYGSLGTLGGLVCLWPGY